MKQLSRLPRSVYLLGIGGAGMSALAEYLQDAGVAVTGYDAFPGHHVQRLARRGVFVTDQLPWEQDRAELCVYSAAFLPEHPALQAARRIMPTVSRGEFMGRLTALTPTVAVAGTHGKTTTACLLTYLLRQGKRSPSFLLGGCSPQLGAAGGKGSREMVVEACEYAGTFLHLRRDVGILLNVDNDHTECYGSEEGLHNAFSAFAEGCKTLIVYGDDPTAESLTRQHPRRITCGEGEAWDFSARQVRMEGGFASFVPVCFGREWPRVRLSIPGRHNLANALCGLAAAHLLGVPLPTALQGLAAFTGVHRRQQVLYDAGPVVMDDYAHHPAELEAVLQSVKAFRRGRVIAVFQPFTYSRTKRLAAEFAQTLRGADRVILAPVMGGREPEDPTVSSELLAGMIPGAAVGSDLADCARLALTAAKPEDLILTMGCGDVYLCAEEICRQLEQNPLI